MLYIVNRCYVRSLSHSDEQRPAKQIQCAYIDDIIRSAAHMKNSRLALIISTEGDETRVDR